MAEGTRINKLDEAVKQLQGQQQEFLRNYDSQYAP